jgi:glycosyltransferase involved in cell wall biosynthesis
MRQSSTQKADGFNRMNQTYSVVIPAYNAAKTISEAIESILKQTLAATRIWVIDDGSIDNTREIAERCGPAVTVVTQKNAGSSAATNSGIERVETALFACLDVDDIWFPEKAETQAAYLAANPDVDGVFSRLRIFRHGHAVDPNAPVFDSWGRTTMMVRTASARRIGPLIDPPGGGGRADMVDWISRGRDLGLRLEMRPEILGLRRIIPGSMSYGHDKRDVGYLAAIKSALDRRRAAKKTPGSPG